jgi:hypothetical protein
MFSGATIEHTPHIGVRAIATPDVLVAKTTERTAQKKAVQQRQREWLQGIVNASGDTLSQIALRANVSQSTLTRIANSAEYSGVLTAVTIERITEAYQVPGPDEFSGRRPMLGGFHEAERFDPAGDRDGITAIVQALLAQRDGSDAWRLRTDALEQVGYLAGDVVIVDMNATPQPQDAVCAQVYDWQRGAAQTVWRVYDPPFLVAASRDRTAHKPLLVDNERVVIKGVVEKMVRPHRLSATR